MKYLTTVHIIVGHNLAERLMSEEKPKEHVRETWIVSMDFGRILDPGDIDLEANPAMAELSNAALDDLACLHV